MQAEVLITGDTIDVARDLKAQENLILDKVLKQDIPRALKAAEKKGFINDPEAYQLMVKNRGSTKRRQLSTIRPQYLKIGTASRPLEFNFYQNVENYDAMIEVAVDIFKHLKRALPNRTGGLRNALEVFVRKENNNYLGGINRPEWLKTFPFEMGDRILISPVIFYANFAEFHHGQTPKTREFNANNASKAPSGQIAGATRRGANYKDNKPRSYRSPPDTKKSMYYMARRFARTYKDTAQVRFFYSNLGIGGSAPAIEISPLGVFANKFRGVGRARSNLLKKAIRRNGR